MIKLLSDPYNPNLFSQRTWNFSLHCLFGLGVFLFSFLFLEIVFGIGVLSARTIFHTS
jgi:hypothetical protein